MIWIIKLTWLGFGLGFRFGLGRGLGFGFDHVSLEGSGQLNFLGHGWVVITGLNERTGKRSDINLIM